MENFDTEDIKFLKEYVSVMSHVAIPLDQLQGEEQAYLGYLLPVITTSWFNLQEMLKKKELTYCEPLLTAVLAGSKKRFQPMFNDTDCRLAAAFHPRFRLHWLRLVDNSSTLYTRTKRIMEDTLTEQLAMDAEAEGGPGLDSSTEEAVEDTGYFSQATVTYKEASTVSSRNMHANTSAQIVKTWLAGKSTNKLDFRAFMGEKALMSLFIQYNTPVPSSAAVERVFSQGKDILREKRSKLTDVNFEELMLLRGNMKHWPVLKDN